MAIAKVIVNGTTRLDLTADTVSESNMLSTYTAHDSTGEEVVGAIGTVPASTVTPTESEQTAVAAGKYTLGAVKVGPISSTYIGSEVPQRDETDLSVSGATVTVPSGYYAEAETASVAIGTAGTPSASKGTVTNHSVSVTPSVTNVTGYITGGTKTGTAVTVTASELVSGTYAVNSSGTKDVTNYASISVKAGTAGTPSATKGEVSNHSVSVTPSVTNVTGFITGSTETGTAVTVSASELVSGTYSVTAAGTTNVTNYANISVPAGSATTPATTITANPSISVNSSGLITATASATKEVTPTVDEGYIESGTKGTVTVSGSNTSQLSTQAAKTVTPTKSSQTAVSAGKYTTGAVTVAAIPAEYITTTDATATADQIYSGATAYVNGSKIIGTAAVSVSGTKLIMPAGLITV